MFADTAEAVRRAAIEPAIRWWIQLETDWQSVVCAVGLLGGVIVFDLPVPE